MRLSVVIPALREEAAIAEAVASARRVADEVLVVDGGSEDGTVAAARGAGARVLVRERGRGRQLDCGARAADGDVLLFLHADARLRGPAREAIERALGSPDVCGGNFLLRFVPADPWARLFSWANDLRRRALRIYYGDSAIFVRRSVYEALGGFGELPIMEDYDLVRRLERHGRTAYVRDAWVEVSARRFARAPARALLTWSAIQTLHALGVPPRHLAALYPNVR